MHIGTLKKLALALTFWMALHSASLKAQVFTNDLPLQADTTGTNPVDFEFRSDGTLMAHGNYGVGSLLTADLGAGTKMFWFPSLAAFRAGGVTGTEWNQTSLGEYSVAFGYNTIASGNSSTASGYSTTASGANSVAFGYNTVASAWTSLAVGTNTTASGNYALATGYLSTASGGNTTALGYLTLASGDVSTAAGTVTTASSYASFAVGAGNVGGGNATDWVATDPLFEVGNGTRYGCGNTSASGTSDAFVVYKNGNANAQGVITAANGGDIPMYTGH